MRAAPMLPASFALAGAPANVGLLVGAGSEPVGVELHATNDSSTNATRFLSQPAHMIFY